MHEITPTTITIERRCTIVVEVKRFNFEMLRCDVRAKGRPERRSDDTLLNLKRKQKI